MARIKPYRLNQVGIVCNVNDSTAIAIRSVDEQAGFVVMPEKYFEAGRFAHEADSWWEVMLTTVSMTKMYTELD